MFGFDFDESEKAPRTLSHQASTISLKTLKRPKVATLRDALSNVDEEQLLYAEDAGLEELIQLYQHDHPKVKSAAGVVLNKLVHNSEKEVVVTAKEAYKALIELTEVKNDDVRAKATVTLAILAEQPDCQDLVLTATDGWRKIFTWLGSSNLGVQQGALQLCASLVINEELREAFLKEGGLTHVLRAYGATDLKVQRALATCLANLAQETDAVKDVIAGDGLKKILAWIAQGDEELTGSAISLLANISNSDELKPALISGNVPAVLPALLTPQNDIIRTGALIVVSNLTTLEESATPIVNGCLDALLNIGKSDNGDHVYRVAVSLNNLSQYEATKNTLRSKAGRLLQALAESEDREVQSEAIEALAELGVEFRTARRSPAVGTSGSTSTEDSDEEEEEVLTKSKEVSTSNPKEREEARNQIKIIIEKLANKNVGADEAERVSNELYQFCLRRENHVAVNAVSGIPVIVDYVKRSDELTPARINLIRSLAELSKNSKNRNRLTNAQALLTVLKYLKGNQYNHLLIAVLVIIEQLTQRDVVLEQVRGAKIVPDLLVQAQNSTNEDVQMLTLKITYRIIFRHVASQVAFRFADGFPLAIKYLSSPHAKVKEQAAYALGGACAGNRKMQQHVRKVKTFKLIAKLLEPKEPLTTRLAAVTAFSYIVAQDQNNQETLRKISKAVDNVISYIRTIPTGSGSGPEQSILQDLHQNSINLLSNMCYMNPKMQNALRSKKAIQCFMAYLTSREGFVTLSMREQATRGLCYISFFNNKNQDVVCTTSVVEALVSQLSSNSKRLQYYTEGLIWSVCNTSKNRRAQFLEAGAIGPLIELTKSPSEAVAKGAEWAKISLTK